jgi:hypothetical protein
VEGRVEPSKVLTDCYGRAVGWRSRGDISSDRCGPKIAGIGEAPMQRLSSDNAVERDRPPGHDL